MNLIFLGDSLMQTNDQGTFPQEGWPQEIHLFLNDPTQNRVLDFALNGRSTKSFIDEGHFSDALEAAQEGDVIFISFGHNDEKDDPLRHTDPYGSYQDNLAMMYRSFTHKGCHVVFLTSVSRLQYDEKGVLKRTHGDYPKAMKEEAEKLGAVCVDLEELSYQFFAAGNFDYNQKFFMCLTPGHFPNYPEGLKDTSHLHQRGAKAVCRLAIPELKKIPYLKDILV